MVTASLDVDGRQVKVEWSAKVVSRFEEMLSEVRAHPSVHLHDRILEQSSGDRLQATVTFTKVSKKFFFMNNFSEF